MAATITFGGKATYPAYGGATTTPLAAPTGVAFNPTSATSGGISWNAVANNSGYTVQIASNNTFTTGLQTLQVAAGNTSVTVSSLSPNTPYYVRVLTKGTGSYSNSGYSAVVSDTTPPVSNAPTITSFSPTSGAAGTTIVATGTNLTGATMPNVGGTVGLLVGTPTATSFSFTVAAGSSTGTVGATTPAGAVASTATFTVTSGQSFAIADSAYPDGAYKQAYQNGYLRNFANAPESDPWTGLQATFTFRGNVASVGAQYATQHYLLSVDGVNQQLTFQSNGTDQPVSVTFPAGSKVLKLYSHDVARNGVGTLGVEGSVVVAITSDVPITWKNATRPVNREIIGGTSIEGGNDASEPLYLGWTVRRRGRYAGQRRTTIDQFSGGDLTDLWGSARTQAEKDAYLNRLSAQANGTGSNRMLHVWGTNYAGLVNGPAADFKAVYLDFLTAWKARRPDVENILITPFPVSTYESRLPAIRTAIEQVATQLSLTYYRGPDLVNVNTMNGPHPNDAGHEQIDQNLYVAENQLNAQAFTDDFPGTDLNPRYTATPLNNFGATLTVHDGVLDIATPTGSTGQYKLSTTAVDYYFPNGQRYAAKIALIYPASDSFLQVTANGPGPGASTGWIYIFGTLRVLLPNSSFGPTLTYSPTTHAYWSVRLDVNTNEWVYETSPNGTAWTEQYRATTTVPTSAQLSVIGGGIGPADGANPTAGGKVDSLFFGLA